MTPAQDGGAAFPIPEVRDADGCGIREGSDGMSRRDWFAGHAPVDFSLAVAVWQAGRGSLYPSLDCSIDRGEVFAILAKLRLEYADAMLAARSATP